MPKKQTLEQFIILSNQIHGFKYDYSKVIYINNNTLVTIICPFHGDFEQRPRAHSTEGKGCYLCGIDKRFKTTEDFIAKANIIHNYKYDYSKCQYLHSWEKLIIICPMHGEFEQQASNHINGQGCPICKRVNFTSTRQEFISKANIIHNYFYNYSKSEYITAHIKIIIICPIHGEFEQTPNSHLAGHGCNNCNHSTGSVSKSEVLWLNSLNISQEDRQKVIKINNKIYKTDAYDPITNTIYEFYGDYWHGNPNIYDPSDINTVSKKSFGQLYEETIDRENVLLNSGYKIISVWESDYEK